MSRAHSPTFQSLHLRHSSFSNHSVTLSTSKIILQFFCCFTCHSSFSNPSFAFPTSQALSSFSNLSVTSPTSQFILQPFRRFTYVTAHSPILLLLHYVTDHSPILLSLFLRHKLLAHYPISPSLHLRHSSISNPSVALSTSQLILQFFCCFTKLQLILQSFFRFSYVTGSYLILQPFRHFT